MDATPQMSYIGVAGKRERRDKRSWMQRQCRGVYEEREDKDHSDKTELNDCKPDVRGKAPMD